MDYKKYLEYKEHTDYQKFMNFKKYVSKAGNGQHYQDIFQSFTDYKQFMDYQKFADFQHLKHSGDFSDYQKYIPQVVKSIIPASTDVGPQEHRNAKDVQADLDVRSASSEPIELISVDSKRHSRDQHKDDSQSDAVQGVDYEQYMDYKKYLEY